VTDRAHAFPRFRLDADSVGLKIRQRGYALPHLLDVRGEFGPLGEYYRVDIDQFQTVVPHPPQRFVKKVGAVPIPIRRVGVGEQLTDIRLGDGPEAGIGDRVQEHVGIAVPNPVDFGRDIDSTDPQRATVAQAVRIIS
jgi:hypothetical protein